MQRRHFETGIFINETLLINAIIEQLDEVWRGAYAKNVNGSSFTKKKI